MTLHIQSNPNLFHILTEATWCLHWVTYLNPKCHLCIIYNHFPVIQSDIFGVFGKVRVVTGIWNTLLWVCACARAGNLNDNRPVGPGWFKRLNPRKRNGWSPLATKFTFTVTTPIHLDKDTCTYAAKACGKVSAEHLQSSKRDTLKRELKLSMQI